MFVRYVCSLLGHSRGRGGGGQVRVIISGAPDKGSRVLICQPPAGHRRPGKCCNAIASYCMKWNSAHCFSPDVIDFAQNTKLGKELHISVYVVMHGGGHLGVMCDYICAEQRAPGGELKIKYYSNQLSQSREQFFKHQLVRHSHLLGSRAGSRDSVH